MNNRQIILKKVNVNNLKNVDLTLDHGKFIVFTGVSGSGKSSLAFDTIYIEGQRKYLESLPHLTSRFLKEFKKPDIQIAEGLSPTIAIEQKTVSKNPRSTVGTLTSIYDFLRVIFSKVGIAHCPISGEIVSPTSKDEILKIIKKSYIDKNKLIFLSPYAKNKKSSFKEDFKDLLKKGYTKVRVNKDFLDLSEVKELDPSKHHDVDIVIDRLIFFRNDFERIKEAVYSSLEVGLGFFKVLNIDTNEEKNFSEYAFAEKSKKSYPPLTPSDFSFNHPSGMCEKCSGLGKTYEFDIEKIVDEEKSIEEDCCQIAGHYNTVRYGNIYRNLSKIYGFDLSTPWKDLSKEAKDIFLHGLGDKWIEMIFVHPLTKKRRKEYVKYKGALYEGHQKLINAKSEIYKKRLKTLMTETICPSCNGSKIKPYPSACQFKHKKIHEISKFTIEKAYDFFSKISLNEQEEIIAKDLIDEILKRLIFLKNVGLGYLTLDRPSPSLSGGEGQRVRLAAQIGSGLIGTTYILDEPSIGLHPKDHEKLLHTLIELKQKGNTVIVVEHDRETILAADTIVDVGPLAGHLGGEIIVQGNVKDIINCPNSLTGKYLSGKKNIHSLYEKRMPKDFLTLYGARNNNLKNVDLQIPLGCFTCITGVSGSGKSSLISETLYRAIYNHFHKDYPLNVGKFKKIDGLDKIDKIVFIDQSPIGRIVRSNPATYMKIFDEIRKLFSSLPDSKIKGYTPGHFSFNVSDGSCQYCRGLGKVKMDMDFMEDVFETCIQCKGKRFSEEVLSIEFKGHNIYDILNLEISEAKEVFENIPSIFSKLKLLCEVGLGYLHLGQSSTTLSGGEAQRIKLAKELSKKPIGHTIYILDEPTTGLHFEDIQNLINILQNLTNRGNSVLVIEHNMDFVAVSDHIIELGPGAGDKGGKIIAEGSFEDFKKFSSPTAEALKKTHQIIPKKEIPPTKIENIKIENAHLYNLKNIDLEIPINKMTVFTGPSGSGKTTLAFDTIFSEGQRSYIETMPPYARQYLQKLPKAKVDKVENLSPCIALEQKSHGNNPRSTVGTITEIYDHLRIIYAHLGKAYCPETKKEIKTISKTYVKNKLLKNYLNKKIHILSKIDPFKGESFEEFRNRLIKKGFIKIRLNNEYIDLDSNDINHNPSLKNEIFLVIDRLIIKKNSEKRILEALETAAKISQNELYIDIEKKDLYFNLTFAVESTGKSYPPITPHSFSFNSQKGMCLKCLGIGELYGLNLSEDTAFLENYCISDVIYYLYYYYSNKYVQKLFEKYFSKLNIDIEESLINLNKKNLTLFFEGSDKYIEIEKNTSIRWKGLHNILSFYVKHSKNKKNIHEKLADILEEKVCPACDGSRLNPLSRNVKLNDMTIENFCALEIKDAYIFIKEINAKNKYLNDILKQIESNLQFLIDIGLGYLSLNRKAPSLSGGEIQRIYLSKNLGSSLANCIYILDEPTIGLHPYNTDLLINALKKLKKLNNTIILVEHDSSIIENADFIVDFGKGAGIHGGNIIFKGSYEKLLKDKNSITGEYLSKKRVVSEDTSTLRNKKKKSVLRDFFSIKNASLHNLKDINIDIPKKAFITVSGVSGSGKSTLINYILKTAIEKSIKSRKNEIALPFAKVENLTFERLIHLDQKLLKSSIRSDVSTYSEVMPQIRAFFTQLPQAKSRGLKPRHFSFNHLSGMCKTCFGFGFKKINLQYLPDVKIKCPSCNGYRLNARALGIKYKNKHIGNIANLTIDQAIQFFEAFPKILRKLNTLNSVGLGYLKLNQSIPSLSGGEGQRLKLANELSKRSIKNSIYIFDEPTIGLHSVDIEKLLNIFKKLVEKGSTLIVIEHNLDIINASDYIIDMGPYSGKYGGEILAKGSLKDILQNKKSLTANYLRKYLS